MKNNEIIIKLAIRTMGVKVENIELLKRNIKTLENIYMFRTLKSILPHDVNDIILILAGYTASKQEELFYYRVGKGKGTTYTLYVGPEQVRPRQSKNLNMVEILSYGTEYGISTLRGHFIQDILIYLDERLPEFNFRLPEIDI